MTEPGAAPDRFESGRELVRAVDQVTQLEQAGLPVTQPDRERVKDAVERWLRARS